MIIIITDLTRFANQEIVCTAGINPLTRECIRPLPYPLSKECRRLNILPGAIIEGDFIKKNCTVPHSEDRGYNKLSFKGPCSSEDFRSILEATISPSVEDGFSISLDAGQKHIPSDSSPALSIITLSINPLEFRIVPDKYNPGKIKAIFTDNSGREFRFLSITDLGFYKYAENHYQDNKIDELNDYIHSQEELYIRLGLSREFKSPDGRTGFWMQVNGIYTFPDYFKDIRCHE
jgi:hypothetical protein